MGTTRVKLIDLSSDKKESKTPKKKAEKLTVETKTQEEQTAPETKPQEAQKEHVDTDTQTITSTPKPKEQKASKQKPKRQKHHLGKNYQEAVKLIDKSQNYNTKEAFDLLRKTSSVKFDPTVEIHFNVVDKNLKGKVNLPYSVGKKKEKKYLVFSQKEKDIKNVTFADEKSVALIENGDLKPTRDFDVVITSPKYMPLLAKVAKILGPKGMMPNPKNGTITEDYEKLISTEDKDSYEYKCDPTAPIVHTKIGKLSNADQELSENLKAIVLSIGTGKIKKAVIKSTMSPAIKLDIQSIAR